MSWTRVGTSGFPYKYRMACCPGDHARPGDYVITIPIWKDGELITTAVIHQRCMAKVMENVPDDKILVDLRKDEIIQRFTKKKDDEQQETRAVLS